MQKLAALLLVLPTLASAQTTIDTGWGGEDIAYFGNRVGDWTVVGQTFRVPDGTPVLNSFSFWLRATRRIAEENRLSFEAFLMEWGGGAATGEVLYRSAVQFGAADIYQARYDFFPGALLLDPSRVYVAFLRVANGPSVPETILAVDGGQADGETTFIGYSGGSLVGVNDHGDFAQLTTEGWAVTDSPADATFHATLAAAPTSAVPEPISMVLLGTGLAGVAGVARHRRRTQTKYA